MHCETYSYSRIIPGNLSPFSSIIAESSNRNLFGPYFFEISTPMEIISIPVIILLEMCFLLPFPWEFHGNSIPMHTSTAIPADSQK